VYPIFRWTGSYFGFVINGNLFDAQARYLGWVSNGLVWHAGGAYLGQLYEGCYVLVSTSKPPPGSQAPRSAPPQPSVPSPWPDRSPRTQLVAFDDALKAFPDA
jgi:hypothetical protein